MPPENDVSVDLAVLEEKVNHMGDYVDAIGKDVGELRTKLDQISTTINRIDTTLSIWMPGVNSSIQDVQQRFRRASEQEDYTGKHDQKALEEQAANTAKIKILWTIVTVIGTAFLGLLIKNLFGE